MSKEKLLQGVANTLSKKIISSNNHDFIVLLKSKKQPGELILDLFKKTNNLNFNNEKIKEILQPYNEWLISYLNKLKLNIDNIKKLLFILTIIF